MQDAAANLWSVFTQPCVELLTRPVVTNSNVPRVVVDGESVAAAVDDDAEPAAVVDAVAGAAPSFATESPNLLSLKPGNCSLAADIVNAVDDEEEEEEPNLGGLSTGFLSTAVAEEEAAPPPPLPASDILINR